MRVTTEDEWLSQLIQLQGEFPWDPNTRRLRLLIMAFGWLVIPFISLGAFLERLEAGDFHPPGVASVISAVMMLLLTCYGLWCGYYLGWLMGGHRYVFSDGQVASVGRRTFWTVDLASVSEIRESGSGGHVVWWLISPQKERGLILYRSLRAELKMPDRGRILDK